MRLDVQMLELLCDEAERRTKQTGNEWCVAMLIREALAEYARAYDLAKAGGFG